jgi:general secretion pathway protein D
MILTKKLFIALLSVLAAGEHIIAQDMPDTTEQTKHAFEMHQNSPDASSVQRRRNRRRHRKTNNTIFERGSGYKSRRHRRRILSKESLILDTLPPTTQEFDTEEAPTSFLAFEEKPDTATSEPTIPETRFDERDTGEVISPPLEDDESSLTHPDETIELYFQEADLSNLVTQIESLFGYSFISDDMLDPNKGKTIKGNKITFKTIRPISKKEAWNLFMMFLDTAGFNIVPQADPNIFRIQAIEKARKAPLPTFINVDPVSLPTSDEMIRYLYYIKNSSVDTIQTLVNALRSQGTSDLIVLHDSKAFVLVEKAYNVQSIMKVVAEFDKVCTTQTWSFLQLRRADAVTVKKLYDSLAPPPDNKAPGQLFGARKPSTTSYFAENTKVIAEPRTNSLIIFGTPEAIKKVERFIIKNVDIETQTPYSPLNVYRLKYADAETIAAILREMAAFGKDTEVGKAGGRRGETRYMKPIDFIAETATNSIIIKGDYDSYLTAVSIIEQLDIAQPQVAIEVLVLSLNIDETKSLGAQIRSKANSQGLFGTNAKFQTSGLVSGGFSQGIVEDPQGPGVQRLLGNLLSLVTNSTAGSTVLTLGKDVFGVWGIVQALQTISDLQVISNPFLITTNTKKATVSLGETRRVITSQILQNNIQTNDTLGDLPANLTVDIVPQINSDGMVILDVQITFNEFSVGVPTGSLTDGNQVNRIIKTKAMIADQEILALGGLTRNTISNTLSKVPILGDIPLIGWFFKNQIKTERKEDLLILISSRIIEPEAHEDTQKFTDNHISQYQDALDAMDNANTRRDPIQRWFFDHNETSIKQDERFIFERRQQEEQRIALEKAQKSNEKAALFQLLPGQRTGPTLEKEPFTTVTNIGVEPLKAPATPNTSQSATLLKKRPPQFSLTQRLQPPTSKEGRS